MARALYRRFHPGHRRERLANRRLYAGLISPGDLCFDIGANVGQTIEALLAIDAIVVAVEPNVNCMPALKYQFNDSPGLTIVTKAMGAAPGTAVLHFTGTNSTASFREDWPFANEQELEVEVSTLDRLIAEFGRPKFLKVDVEGFELEVFKGLSQAIPVIYFEMHGNEVGATSQILERLASIGEIAGVNAVSGDNSVWLLKEWVGHDQFVARLGDPIPDHANVIVRMKT